MTEHLQPKHPPAMTQQTKARPSLLWANAEQAQRAWAVTAASRFLAGRDGLGTVSVVSAADQILGYVRGGQ